jgi:hypothetical protein
VEGLGRCVTCGEGFNGVAEVDGDTASLNWTVSRCLIGRESPCSNPHGRDIPKSSSRCRTFDKVHGSNFPEGGRFLNQNLNHVNMQGPLSEQGK